MSNRKGNPFSVLGLKPWVTQQMQKIGIKNVTPILQNCIPQILAGADCIAVSQKRTSKTFAYVLPILQKLCEQPVSHFALILTPSRDLADLISELFKVAGKPLGIRVCKIVGSTDQLIESQKLMASPHIVVAMPQHLIDHLRCCFFSFRSLKFLVIDEADCMLCGIFDKTLDLIKRCIPKERQNLFFSATMKDYMKTSSIFPISDQAFEWSEELNEARNTKNAFDFHNLFPDYGLDMAVIHAHRKYIEENENADAKILKFCDLRSVVLYTFKERKCRQKTYFPRQNYDYASLALNKNVRPKETEMVEPIDLRIKIVGAFPQSSQQWRLVQPNITNHPAGVSPLDPSDGPQSSKYLHNNWQYNNHRSTNLNGRIQRFNSSPRANLNSRNIKIILEELKQRNPDIIIEPISTNRQQNSVGPRIVSVPNIIKAETKTSSVVMESADNSTSMTWWP